MGDRSIVMKIYLLLIIVCIALLVGMSGCSGNGPTSQDIVEEYIIEISDYNFGVQVQEIQLSRHEFLGRTIRYEGMFMYSSWEDEIFYYVARAEGGCCGVYGFEVYLNDIPSVGMETWVEITGVLEEFYVEGEEQAFLRINLVSMVER